VVLKEAAQVLRSRGVWISKEMLRKARMHVIVDIVFKLHPPFPPSHWVNMRVPIITTITLLSPCAQDFYIYSDVRLFTFPTSISSYIGFLVRRFPCTRATPKSINVRE
jgi:hypothetical protein